MRDGFFSHVYEKFVMRDAAYEGETTVCMFIEDDASVHLRVPGDWTPPREVQHPSEQG